MTSSICSSFQSIILQSNHTNKNLKHRLISHCKNNKHSFNFTPLIVSSSSFNDDSVSPQPNPKQSQISYDPSEDLFGISADLKPRMKIIHGDPELHAQRVTAIKKSKGSADARKNASESMKSFFSNPENRRMRSISMKGVKFYCKNCGREGHRRLYCPELDQTSADRRFRCSLWGEKGHNRRSCKIYNTIQSQGKTFKPPCCTICGKSGHNRRTCLQRAATTTASKTPAIKKAYFDLKKRVYTCRVCQGEGH